MSRLDLLTVSIRACFSRQNKGLPAVILLKSGIVIKINMLRICLTKLQRKLETLAWRAFRPSLQDSPTELSTENVDKKTPFAG